MLDDKRLGNQRNEARIILNSNLNGNGWYNHPATKMWYGYEEALKQYVNCCIEEWINRGKNNSIQFYKVNHKKIILPKWLGKKKFHSAHRAALLYKNFDYYSKFSWKEEPELDYWWPRKYFLR